MKLPNLFGKPSSTRPQIARQDALRVYPVRNPSLDWELDDQGLVVATLVRPKSLKSKIMGSFLMLPDSRQLKLDEVGSYVWSLCDGKHAVTDLIAEMSDKYKLSRREVEVSLTEFLRMLAKRGMIAVAVPREIVDKLDPQTAAALGIVDMQIVEDEATEEKAEGEPEESS
ncbi:MAG TPA: PqqD family protein [Armatimonadota bacterium]|jgi:hypothetical protein